MNRFQKIFKSDSSFNKIIAMIHVDALPGTPKNTKNVDEIVEKALKEAEMYKSLGVKAMAIENMHDIPYLNSAVGPEIVSTMSIVGHAVKKATELPLGIQILAAANKESLAVAHASGMDFIRVEGFVFSHIADEGQIDSCAGELLRYRKVIGAEEIAIFCDIKKKHSSHAITADIDIAETARAAEFFLSDGVIVTGSETGATASREEIVKTSNSVDIPVFVGSGVNFENLQDYHSIADALIVGSYFKKEGNWVNELDRERIKKFIDKANSLMNSN